MRQIINTMSNFLRQFILIFLIPFAFTETICAQISPFISNGESFVSDSLSHQGELSLAINSQSFFRDNEYSTDFLEGYTLPGFRLIPKAVYYPTSKIKLEGGIYMLRYWGANKYPNFAYRDIAKWKGNQHQTGVHFLPYLRAQANITDNFSIVLGDLYGGTNHNLIEPLYDPELNLTADPEAGLQFLFNSKYFNFDTWINWESFIFNEDNHQEEFVAGLSTRLKFTPQTSSLHVYMPMQIVFQHRGGEIDTIKNNSINTLMNCATGLGLLWKTGNPLFKSINVECDYSLYKQMAGELWPFEKGHGFYTCASANIGNVIINTSYWKCHDFISILGSPFFGAASIGPEITTFKNPSLTSLEAIYSLDFGKGISLSFDGEVRYQSYNDEHHTSLSAGVCLIINPSFLIKKF